MKPPSPEERRAAPQPAREQALASQGAREDPLQRAQPAQLLLLGWEHSPGWPQEIGRNLGFSWRLLHTRLWANTREEPRFSTVSFHLSAWERKIHFLPSQSRARNLSETRLILTPYVHHQTHTLLHLKHEYILLTALMPLSIHCNYQVLLPLAFTGSLRREILKGSIQIFVFTTMPNILANSSSFWC